MELFDKLIGDNQKILGLEERANNFFNEERYESARQSYEGVIDEIKDQGFDKKKRGVLIRSINERLYSIRGNYIPLNDIKLGCYVNAEVDFKPEMKEITDSNGIGLRRGDPGFEIRDDYGYDYECYIKESPGLEVGDEERAWITGYDKNKRIIYLEPRVDRGNHIFIKIKGKAKREGEYYFRFLSYDGFIKNEGRTRDLNIHINNFYELVAKYSRASSKVDMEKRKVLRVGIMFGEALRKASRKEYEDNKNKIIRELS